MITPAEAAYAHETGVAAFAMMMLAYVYQFLEGTRDVAAAVAENVVVMSDSITAMGIEQFEIAMPEIRRIAVATFAAIVIIFLWIISKELRKKYGKTPEANLADRLQALPAPADSDDPPELADPAPALRPANFVRGSASGWFEEGLPPMPWMTKRVLDSMGPKERHMSSLALLRRRGGITFSQHRGLDGEYI